MSDTPNNVPGDDLPINEAPATTGEGVAARYVDSELKKAKGSLLRTQIGSVLAVLILGGYTMYVTGKFRESLQPTEAATIAKGLVADKLNDGGVQFADYVKKEVPAYIRQAPDYAKKQLPEYRQQIETRVNTEIDKYATQTSEQLGSELDKFLDQNKEAVGELLKNGQDPAATAKITGNMKELFVGYLNETPQGGESIKTKLDQALDILTRVDARMKRLATATDLTPSEKSAKRAIAILTRQIHTKRMEEGHEDAIAPKVIQQAGDAIKSQAQDSANNAANAVNSASNAVQNAVNSGSR